MTSVVERVSHQLSSKLSVLEREREQLAKRTKGGLLLLAIVCAGSALVARLALANFSPDMARTIPVLILVGGVVLAVWQVVRRHNQWKQRVLDTVIPTLCESLGEMTYQPTLEASEFLPAFVKLDLVGGSGNSQLSHCFSGRYKKAGFELVEATLKTSGSDAKTFFEGLLLRVQLSHSVDQRLLIAPRVSIKLLNKRADMKELSTGDPDFDAKFVVHHEVARPDGADMIDQILTPDFRRSLLEFHHQESKQAYGMPGFTIGLMYDSLYMAMTRYQKTRSIGGIQMEGVVPFLDVRFFLMSDSRLDEKVTAMVKDVTMVHRMIDQLLPLRA